MSDHWYIKKATTCSAEKCTFDYLQYLDFTSHKLLFVSLGQQIWKDFATTEKGNSSGLLCRIHFSYRTTF